MIHKVKNEWMNEWVVNEEKEKKNENWMRIVNVCVCAFVVVVD